MKLLLLIVGGVLYAVMIVSLVRHLRESRTAPTILAVVALIVGGFIVGSILEKVIP